jgi:hypothetical protein
MSFVSGSGRAVTEEIKTESTRGSEACGIVTTRALMLEMDDKGIIYPASHTHESNEAKGRPVAKR